MEECYVESGLVLSFSLLCSHSLSLSVPFSTPLFLPSKPKHSSGAELARFQEFVPLLVKWLRRLIRRGPAPSWPRGMQNIINAKCLKAVENIPVTAQLECSLTTRSLMLPLPERAARPSPPAAGSSSRTSVARVSRPESQQLTSGSKRKCVTAVRPFQTFIITMNPAADTALHSAPLWVKSLKC